MAQEPSLHLIRDGLDIAGMKCCHLTGTLKTLWPVETLGGDDGGLPEKRDQNHRTHRRDRYQYGTSKGKTSCFNEPL
jgi:hypothetical protein